MIIQRQLRAQVILQRVVPLAPDVNRAAAVTLRTRVCLPCMRRAEHVIPVPRRPPQQHALPHERHDGAAQVLQPPIPGQSPSYHTHTVAHI
jgi:hypothetical protein